MKNVVLASMLAVSAVTAPFCVAQAPAAAAGSQTTDQQPAGQAAAGQVQLSPAEYSAYQNVTTAADPAAKATAGEAFLQQYPQSTVKAAVLEQVMNAYAQQNNVQKALDTGDKILQTDPNNYTALFTEVYLLKSQADQSADASTRQTGYSKAATLATRALSATKPAAVEQSQWDQIQTKTKPTLYSVIGFDALQKKDSAGAISAYTSELKAVPEDQTKQPGVLLQDTYYLGTAYYQSTTPDYLSCTYFATRAAVLAPDQFKAQFQPVATYCYKKYHGGDDGYDAVKTAAAASLFPSDSFKSSVKPAPTPADQATAVLDADKKEDPTLVKTNIQDREFVIQNGTADQAESEFTPIKGKEIKVSGVVVAISGTDLQLAVSDDSKAANPKVADFDVTLKAEPTKVPAVDSTVDVLGTIDSYTQKPLLVKMTAGEIQAKAATKSAAPARRTTAPRRR